MSKLEEGVAIMQHHDAITGTAEPDVSLDYIRILYEAILSLKPVSFIKSQLLSLK